MTSSESISVSIVVVCRNEVGHIRDCVRGILAQERLPLGCEVIIADGMSDDGTREALGELSVSDPRIRIIDNPGRIVSTGLNAGIRASCGHTIIRMDAHTEYAADYVACCISVLESSGADNVGGPWRARGRGYLQTAIAHAFQSPFCSGGAGSHRASYEGPVDSVYLGCWRKRTLVKLGLFDEELVRNQDDELNLRLVRSGGRIWQTPVIRSWYYPRSSFLMLFRQYVQYGYWKVRVIQKHRLPASVRHLVPGIFVSMLLITSALSMFYGWARWVLIAVLGLYLCACVAASLVCCASQWSWRYLPIMPAVFATYHVGYGWGFLRGVVDFAILGRRGRDAYRRLSR